MATTHYVLRLNGNHHLLLTCVVITTDNRTSHKERDEAIQIHKQLAVRQIK